MKLARNILFALLIGTVVSSEALEPVKGELYVPADPIPLPDGAWASPERTEQWLISTEAWATTTGLPYARLINQAVHQRFDPLKPSLMNLRKIEACLQEARTIDAVVDTQKNRLFVPIHAHQGLPELIAMKDSGWNRLADRYKRSQSIVKVQRLWDDTEAVANRLEAELLTQRIIRVSKPAGKSRRRKKP